MPIESGATISSLDQSWPLGNDPALSGDDHLRLIKSVLKAQFPGDLGDGFAEAITATEDELNSLTGVTSNIADSLTSLDDAVAALGVNLSAPAGTKMVFFNAAVPSGWTQDIDNNDYMLRVVNTAGGGSGGTTSPISSNFDHAHTTESHTLTVAEMPSHNHSNGYTPSQAGSGGGGPATIGNSVSTGNIGGNNAHSHGNTGEAEFTYAPRYLNTIIGIKD